MQTNYFINGNYFGFTWTNADGAVFRVTHKYHMHNPEFNKLVFDMNNVPTGWSTRMEQNNITKFNKATPDFYQSLAEFLSNVPAFNEAYDTDNMALEPEVKEATLSARDTFLESIQNG